MQLNLGPAADWAEQFARRLRRGFWPTIRLIWNIFVAMTRSLWRTGAKGVNWLKKNKEYVQKWVERMAALVILAAGGLVMWRYKVEVAWALIGLVIGGLIATVIGLALLVWVVKRIIRFFNPPKPQPKSEEEKTPEPYQPAPAAKPRTMGWWMSFMSALQGALWLFILVLGTIYLFGLMMQRPLIWWPLALVAGLLVLSYAFGPHPRTGTISAWYRFQVILWMALLLVGWHALMLRVRPVSVTNDADSAAFFQRHHLAQPTGLMPTVSGNGPAIRRLSNGVTEVVFPGRLDGVYDTGLTIGPGQTIDGVVIDSTYVDHTGHPVSVSGMRVIPRNERWPRVMRPSYISVNPSRREMFPMADQPIGALLGQVGQHKFYVGNGSWSIHSQRPLWQFGAGAGQPLALQLNVHHGHDPGLRGYVRVWLIQRGSWI